MLYYRNIRIKDECDFINRVDKKNSYLFTCGSVRFTKKSIDYIGLYIYVCICKIKYCVLQCMVKY